MYKIRNREIEFMNNVDLHGEMMQAPSMVGLENSTTCNVQVTN
jgi:hypothetical protein